MRLQIVTLPLRLFDLLEAGSNGVHVFSKPNVRVPRRMLRALVEALVRLLKKVRATDEVRELHVVGLGERERLVPKVQALRPIESEENVLGRTGNGLRRVRALRSEVRG